MALTFGFMIAVDLSVPELKSPLTLVVFYMLITTAELCIFPSGLVEISRRAPKRAIGLLMGCWYCTQGGGSLIAGLLGGLTDSYPVSMIFALLAALGLVASLFALGI